MKKPYEIPELDILCFAPCQRIANSGDDFGAQFFSNSSDTEGASGVEVTIATDPEGGID